VIDPFDVSMGFRRHTMGFRCASSMVVVPWKGEREREREREMLDFYA
jgi:hypothetical protein